MSSMNFMEKLLDGVKVEWKALGEMAEIGTGSSNRQDENENGLYPFYVRSKTILKSNTFQFDETAIIIPGEGGIGDIFHYVQGKYALHQRAYRIHVTSDSLNSKFLFHIMSASFKQYILMKSVGATATSIRKPMLENFQIPIPCPDDPEKSIAIQAEIVRILDAFTELTSELTSELIARKNQYSYYRDQLLSFKEEEVEWKMLGGLCSIGVGQLPVGNEIGEYPFVNAGTTPSGYVPAYNTEPDTITTPSRGQGGIGYVGYQTTRFWCGPLCYRIRSTSEILTTRFLYHVMTNSMRDIIGLANMTGVPALNKKDLVGFSVPIPSLAEQERIVAILDKFDALTNSISEGLPREIALRQKQYEYYRDLLLSFPKPQEAAA
jgi:type I restriction enzyme S subunit